jgi:acetyltransferase-like isoleucine patch superfamily enzyme
MAQPTRQLEGVARRRADMVNAAGDPSVTRMAAWCGYARAWWWRLRGARIGARSRISAECEASWLAGITLGERVVLERGVVLKLVDRGATLRIADNAFVGRGSVLDVSQGLAIGEGTLIAPGCFVTDHNHGIAPGEAIWKQPCVARPVRIGANAWLGAKAVVLPGVSIGDGAVVAAGAVVTKDVAANEIVAGVPARRIGDREGRAGDV